MAVLWLASLAAAGYAGALAYRNRATIRTMLAANPVLETNLYNLSLREVALPIEGRSESRGGIEGRDGGVAPLRDGVLVADRMGLMWYLGPDLTLGALNARIPVNYSEFETDPYNVETTIRSRFAVKDILTQESPTGALRLLSSYNHWYAEDDCYSLRVGILETTTEDLISGNVDADWATIWETDCVALSENPGGIRNPTLGAGGRLVALTDDQILFAMGGFGPATPNDPDGPYGKTVLIDLVTGESSHYSKGHRNPQGLAASSDGEIWLTEHAERGGDELNRIVEGEDYGFPIVSYGTNYESMVWKTNPRQGRHEGYRKPLFAWVPSIGSSQLIVLEKDLFRYWKGDLIVSSLRANSLFRVRVEDDRVIFVEPIRIGHRIRDITERADGAIVLKTDGDVLVVITPFDMDRMRLGDAEPEVRGRILASGCSGCHSLTEGGAEGIGPTLWNVVDRPVAARPGYGYSDALRRTGGRWTSDRLRAFLEDPQGFAPGTTMEMTSSYTDQEISDLITYLQTLQ